MTASRRDLITIAGIGLGGLAALSARSNVVFAQDRRINANPPAPDSYKASTAERALQIVNLDLLEAEAKRMLPEAGYVFVSGGSGSEWTLRENRRAFDDFPILPQRLMGVAANDVDLRIRLLGHDLPFPILVAPMGAHAMVHDKAEADTAAGTGAAGTLYESSGASTKPLEEIARATKGPKWFQLYFNSDVGVTRSLLQRAREAGYSAVILTADALGPGQSDAFIALGRPFRPGMTFGNHDPQYGGSGDFLDQKVDLTWDDIDFVHEGSGLPVVVKGILRPEDAWQAIKAGAVAIQVSNHGGRQQDGVPASISMLPAVADAVGGQVPILVDGGVRHGIDVFRALALGATAVAVGRPVLYGLAVGGAEGVRSVLEYLRDDLKTAMLLSGARKVSDITRTSLLAGSYSGRR
jgi:lactate oxidase